MAKIFISSTSEDLHSYRLAAEDAIKKAGHQPIGMEDFAPQGTHPPLDACLRKVEECNRLIVIVAHRYGWVPSDQPNAETKSITWLECEHAMKRGIEVIPFLADEKHPWPPELEEAYRLTQAFKDGTFTPDLPAEVQRNVARLQEFKAWLNGRGFRGTFTNEHELKILVLQALLSSSEQHGDTSKYLDWLREYTAWIDIRGLQVGSAKSYRFPIRDLYTPLTTAAPVEPDRLLENPERREVPLEEMLTQRRVVIIGDPGSGKTTFLRRLAQECCAPSGELAIPAGTFPLFIRISELAQHIRTCDERKQSGTPTTPENAEWLLHFLECQSWDLDARFFDRKMHEEKTMVLLDGLDEAPDSRTRTRIARLFENATTRYRECRFVVTTRPGAYQGKATLADFAEVKVSDLSDKSVESFLGHWSAALHPGNPEKAEAHRKELLGAVEARTGIRLMARNPVMLTALAVLHWNDKRLPEQRAELYESILAWLSRAREEKPGRESPETCLRWLGHLALGMQTQLGGRLRQIGKRAAAEIIAPDLRDIPEPERAEDFLDREEVDSGIIVSRGPSVEFWHLTFQEHLAARTIAGLTDAAQRDLLLATDRLYEPEWREVVLLYAGLLAVKQGLDKVDAFFRAVLDSCGVETKDRVQSAALLGVVLLDLTPLGYKPRDDGRYRELMTDAMAVFDPVKSAGIPLQTRVEAAEAIGRAGDPRLRENSWVRIPAGTFLFGDGDGTPVELNAFEMGKYPVTVEEYSRLVQAGGPTPGEWDKQLLYPNRPVVHVSWHDAEAYCNWAGVRLPTDAEWERAKRGSERRDYPWGNHDYDTTRANCHEANINAPTPVGLFPKGATPDGIHDLMANVWEWVAVRYWEYSKEAQHHFKDSDKCVARGGSCTWDLTHLLSQKDRLRRKKAEDRSYDVGFRCARDVPYP